MAEGFESYHVPQQSRRDKLRILAQNHVDSSPTHAGQGNLILPLYDPNSLLSSSDLLHHYNNQFKTSQNQNQVCIVKEEGVNFMGFASSSSTSHHHHHNHNHPYNLDPHSSFHINPNSMQDINGNPFFYNLRDFDQSYNGDTGGSGGAGGGDSEIVVYKPETLSLSLSSHTTNQNQNQNHNHHQNNLLPLELNLQRYGGSSIYGPPGGGVVTAATGSPSNEASRSSVPLGPFTGYASILKGSRFLKPAQQLLEEFCNVGQGIYVEKISVDSSLMDPPPLNASGIVVDDGDGSDNGRKKSRLISMLDEVYRRYKQYYQQMQAVVASFEYVAGLGNAAPFANLALKAMSKHFRCLKNAIMDQIQVTSKTQVQISHGKDEAQRFGNTDRSLYSPRPGFLERQPVWRPQRGLPERAVTVLRAWLFEHFLHPYPTDTDKLMLAKQTGLSRSQVSNWFINARVRLWKPMVEEIHMLETRQSQKAPQRDERSANVRSSDHHRLVSSNSLPSDQNPSTSTQSKRTINEFHNIPVGSEEPMNMSYNNMSSHPHVGVGVSMAGGSGSSGVSLTLGLHQNNIGIGLGESYPINAAQRFGLGMDANNEGYVLSGYNEAQHRHFGRDVIGGQLLHDFVG